MATGTGTGTGTGAGAGPAGTCGGAAGSGVGTTSSMPTTRASGFGPIRSRFAPYRARHPPRTRCLRAIDTSVSPSRTACIRPASPYRLEHTGHAFQPCEPRTSSATRICCTRLARSARCANASPPYSSHVGCQNCSPP